MSKARGYASVACDVILNCVNIALLLLSSKPWTPQITTHGNHSVTDDHCAGIIKQLPFLVGLLSVPL